MSNIRQLFEESINVKSKILETGVFIILSKMGDEISNAIQANNKIMLCVAEEEN